MKVLFAGFGLVVASGAFAADDAGWKSCLPHPIYDEKPELVELYDKAWEIAHTRIDEVPGIPAPRYMDEAHRSDRIWIWDTCFMVHFCKYCPSEFPGIESLENFYGVMLADRDTPLPKVKGNRWCGADEGKMLDFRIHHPDNPPLFAWTEYAYALQTGDRARLEKVYFEKRWLQRWYELFESFDPAASKPFGSVMKVAAKRTENGYYWNGCASGMDNTPRGRKGKTTTECDEGGCPDNPDLLWVDAIAQQGLAALHISRIADLLGRPDEAAEWRKRYEKKRTIVNGRYFDWKTGLYYDIDEKGRFVKVPSIASYWPMLAEMPDPGHLEELLKKLTDPRWFGGEVPTPSLARMDGDFQRGGGYWRGSMWLPTTYMVLKALDAYGENALARELARKVVDHMYRTYADYEPHTIWECYSPTKPEPATYAKRAGRVRDNFCGWSALGPISLFIEDVIGIKQANAFTRTLCCDFVREIKGRVGVKNYRFGDVVCDIVATTDRIAVRSNAAFTLKVNGKTYAVKPGTTAFERPRGDRVKVSDFDTVQAALDSGARTIVFDKAHSPFVVPDTLKVRADSELVFEDGAELVAERGRFRTIRSSLLKICGVSNVVVRGQGGRGVLRMWREDYDAKRGKGPNAQGYSWSEWRHAVSIGGSRNVRLENLLIERSGGDGISTGDCVGLTIRNVICDRNYRQGLSMCGGDDFLAEGCVFSNTKGTAPQSGVDIEPWKPSHTLRNVVFRDCLSTNNAAAGFEVYLRDLDDTSEPVDVRFESCRTEGNAYGYFVNGGYNRTNHYVRGTVKFTDCVTVRSKNMGFFIGNTAADAWTPVIENCRIEGAEGRWTQSDVTFWHEGDREPVLSGVRINGLKIVQSKDQPWLVYRGNGNVDDGRYPHDVTGNVTLVKPDGCTEKITLNDAYLRNFKCTSTQKRNQSVQLQEK